MVFLWCKGAIAIVQRRLMEYTIQNILGLLECAVMGRTLMDEINI